MIYKMYMGMSEIFTDDSYFFGNENYQNAYKEELSKIKGLQVFRFKNYKEDKPEFDNFIKKLII